MCKWNYDLNYFYGFFVNKNPAFILKLFIVEFISNKKKNDRWILTIF